MESLKLVLVSSLLTAVMCTARAGANEDLAEKLYAIKAVTGIGVNYNDYAARVQDVAVARERAERTEGVNSHLSLAALHYTFVYERWHLANGFTTASLRERADQMNKEDWEDAAQWLSRYEDQKVQSGGKVKRPKGHSKPEKAKSN